MTQRLVIVLVAGALGGVGAVALPAAAQVTPSAVGAQGQVAQTPAVGSQLPALPGGGVGPMPGQAPGAVQVQGTAQVPGVTQLQASSSGRLSPSAGHGLPGMSGGPPVNAPMGAGDPSARYMSPLVIGPLACDLVADPACL
ncbi:hypothetical protein [Nitrospira sp. Kam-Ns4a]